VCVKDEVEKVPEKMDPKKNPRELLKQLSRISVVNGTPIMTFNDPKGESSIPKIAMSGLSFSTMCFTDCDPSNLNTYRPTK